jgi:LuxR family transcriptional regulator, regulator of acetate metabolism
VKHESLAHVALQESPADILDCAVATLRATGQVDSAFAALATDDGRYFISARDGLRQPMWSNLEIRSGRGLGGRVIAERRASVAPNYLEDSTITHDYHDVVKAEGLRGIACVPVAYNETQAAALLYFGERRVGSPGERLVGLAERVADMAAVGLAIRARARVNADGNRARTAVLAGREISLTSRERDILDLLGEGLSNSDIARRLFIAESTAKDYVRGLRMKLDARSRLDAVARARRCGLL